MPRKKAKYDSLKALAEAIRWGEVPAAHCWVDKEVIDIYAGELADDNSSGAAELLYTEDEVRFTLSALEALGVEAAHV